jgi:hypothetical protein
MGYPLIYEKRCICFGPDKPGVYDKFPSWCFCIAVFCIFPLFFSKRGMSVGQGEFVLAKFEGWKGKFVVHPQTGKTLSSDK